MKILMVCRQHPLHLYGGLAIASWNTARVARDIGHEVLYVTGEHPDGRSGVIKHDGIRVHWVKGLSHEADGYEMLYKWLWKNYKKLDKKYGPFDIIHSQSSGATSLAELDPHVPIVFQDHGTQLAAMQDDINITTFGIKHSNTYKFHKGYDKAYDAFDNFISAREIDYLRKFDAVLATSAISAWDLRTRYFLTNTHLLYHAIYDVEPVEKNNDMPVVGFFAYALDSPHKSTIFGLKKLLPLKDKIRIKMVGGGSRAAAFAKENFPHVEATGYIPETEAKKELASVDVLFESSCHHRGLNLTGITALGLGIPILAFPSAGHMDLIGVENTPGGFGPGGAIVDPFDDKAIIDALTTLLDSNVVYRASARAHFDRRFSPKACGKTLDAVYQSIAKREPEKKYSDEEEGLTVVVPPGIGDTVWIYCKLATLGKPLDFIVCDHGDKNRTVPLMELLPLARSCVYSKKYSFHEHLRKEGIPANTAKKELLLMPNPILAECNTHLEAGRPLEDWLPDIDLDYHVEIQLKEKDMVTSRILMPGKGYLCIFCASENGIKGHVGSWGVDEWLDFLIRFQRDVRDVPIVIIGADWDLSFANKLQVACAKNGIDIVNVVGKLPLSGSLDIIKRSCYFVGFPSGLSILAAIMGEASLMFYTESISGIMYMFADPDLMENGIFTEMLYAPPEEVIDVVKDTPPFKEI